jgi:hypothetical protein
LVSAASPPQGCREWPPPPMICTYKNANAPWLMLLIAFRNFYIENGLGCPIVS